MRRKFLLLVAISFALAGCATEPKTITRTVEVKIPVPVPCDAPDVPRPAYALDAADPSQSIYVKGRAALVELEQRQAREVRLEAALEACRAHSQAAIRRGK